MHSYGYLGFSRLPRNHHHFLGVHGSKSRDHFARFSLSKLSRLKAACLIQSTREHPHSKLHHSACPKCCSVLLPTVRSCASRNGKNRHSRGKLQSWQCVDKSLPRTCTWCPPAGCKGASCSVDSITTTSWISCGRTTSTSDADGATIIFKYSETFLHR